MDEQFVIMLLVGPVVVILVEFVKLLALVGGGSYFTEKGKVAVMFIVSWIVAFVALLVSGKLGLNSIVTNIVALRGLSGFELFRALSNIVNEVTVAGGVVVASSQAVYTLFKERLKNSGYFGAVHPGSK